MAVWVWITAIMLSVVIASAALFYIYIVQDDDDVQAEKGLDQDQEIVEGSYSIKDHDFTEPPPKPIFSNFDTLECREKVNGYYISAELSFKKGSVGEAKLNKSFEAILARQKNYGVQLARNKDF